jgi:hypothetical protein
MRTTVRIDDDLHRRLKDQAHRQNVSLTSLVNRVLRNGLDAPTKSRPKRRYREKVFDMGVPKINLDKPLAFAAALEDEEIIRKMSLGK